MKRASLTSLQQSLVLASMRAPRSGAYVIQEVCETTELLDIDRLQHAWRNMAARHEALRTSVETDSRGNLWQQVNETSQIPWQELAWNGVPTKEAPSKLDGWLRTDRELGFDFRSGVPARVTLSTSGRFLHSGLDNTPRARRRPLVSDRLERVARTLRSAFSGPRS